MLAEGIISLLQKKIDALDEILDVTQAQYALIQGDDISLLMDNIEQRQKLIDSIDGLDAAMARLPAPSEHEKNVIDRVMQDIRSLLLDIAAQDKRNEAEATARLQSFRAEVKSANEFIRVIEGYVEPMFPAESYTMEKKK